MRAPYRRQPAQAPRPDRPVQAKRYPAQPECWECVHRVDVQNGPYGMLACSLLPDFPPFGHHWGCCSRFSANPRVWKNPAHTPNKAPVRPSERFPR